MTPKTPNSTISKKILTKNCHWNGTAGGLSSSDESRTRLMRLQLRATVEPEHFEVFGDLFSVCIVIL